MAEVVEVVPNSVLNLEGELLFFLIITLHVYLFSILFRAHQMCFLFMMNSWKLVLCYFKLLSSVILFRASATYGSPM